MKSSLKITYPAFILMLMFTLSSANSHAADTVTGNKDAAHVRVVFQVSDDDAKKWNLALNNVKNVQQELGATNVEIEIVTYGPGINMLKFESTVSDRVDEALKSGIKIVACENTMKAMKIGKADMMSTIGYVPGGVVEIIKKQIEGFAYIRP